MNMHRITRACAVASTAALLGACGGGGSSSDAGSPGPAAAAPPTSGAYAWSLKAQGPTTAQRYGLSLLHPSTPGTEWVVELASSAVTDAVLVSTGTVFASGLKADSLRPYALLYIVGGDVRRVPMEANGTAPASRVQRAQSTSACGFLVEALDYATPENSRYIVSTAGADGQCETADDGRAEVRLNTTNGLTFAPITGPAPLGAFRDIATLAARGWIYPKAVSYWDAATGNAVATRSSTDPAFTGVLASTYRSALVTDGVQLSVLDLPAGTSPIENKLGATLTGGTGWVSIGFDPTSFYVFRNSGNTTASNWTVLKIGRTTPSATVLATGTGQVTVASMGSARLYLTVLGAASNRLLAVSKTIGLPQTTLETTATTTLTTVQTSANTVHQLWRVTNIGTTSITYAIEMIDETGAKLYSTTGGGFPMAVAEPAFENFDASESRTRFVFADGYGARAFGDATLVGYDTVAKAATAFGKLPGSAEFGGDFVFASVMGGPSTFMTGFAARSLNGSIQETGAKVFSFDTATASSLKYTTAAQ